MHEKLVSYHMFFSDTELINMSLLQRFVNEVLAVCSIHNSNTKRNCQPDGKRSPTISKLDFGSLNPKQPVWAEDC